MCTPTSGSNCVHTRFFFVILSAGCSLLVNDDEVRRDVRLSPSAERHLDGWMGRWLVRHVFGRHYSISSGEVLAARIHGFLIMLICFLGVHRLAQVVPCHETMFKPPTIPSRATL